MAPFTIKNLKDIEDAAPQFGLAPALEARFAGGDLGCERIGLAYERLAPGAKGKFGHSHTEDEEVYVVVAGSGRIRLGDELFEIGLWDAIRVAPETFRAFAAGPDGLELLAFGTHTPGDGSTRDIDWDD